MNALTIGTAAPDFSFVDEAGPHALADFRGAPVILAFPRGVGRRQPALQYLTVEGERIAVILPADESVAGRYGVAERFGVFVISGNGSIAWRHVGDDETVNPPVSRASSGVDRREFLAAMLAASLAVTLGERDPFASGGSVERRPAAQAPAGTVDVAFALNGREVRLSLDPRVSLLDALRERLRLTGTKKGCDHGQCGACTVHVDGRRVLSCLTLAASVHGRAVTTIEGLGQ